MQEMHAQVTATSATEDRKSELARPGGEKENKVNAISGTNTPRSSASRGIATVLRRNAERRRTEEAARGAARARAAATPTPKKIKDEQQHA